MCRCDVMFLTLGNCYGLASKLHEQAVKARINGNLALPQGVVLLGQHLDKDPDKGFSGVSGSHLDL